MASSRCLRIAERLVTGLCAGVGVAAAAARRAACLAAAAAARTAIDLGGPRHRRFQRPARRLERFQAPRRHRARLSATIPPARPPTGRVAIVVHGSSGSSGGTIHALSTALAAHGRARPLRSISAATAPQAPAATSAMSASSRTISPISSAMSARPRRRAADADRPFLRRRLCAAGRGLADPEPVRAHRAAGALSRLRRADQPRRTAAAGPAPDIPRIVGLTGAAQHRHHLLRGACRCSPSRCRRIPTRPLVAQLYRPPDAQFRASAAISATTSPPRASRSRIFAGADDELMFAGQISPTAVRGARRPVDVKLIDGVNHMGIVSDAEGGIQRSPTTSPRAAGEDLACMTVIDRQQAASALSRHRRRSRGGFGSRGSIDLASLMLMLWGALTFAGYVVDLSVRRARPAMPGSRSMSRASPASFAISAFDRKRGPASAASTCGCWRRFLLFFAFGSSAGDRARPFHAAAARHVLADLFHAGLCHRRPVDRAGLRRDRAVASPR